MDGNYITREVHEEFARRMEIENQRLEDENKRQNRRLSASELFNKLKYFVWCAFKDGT